MIAIEIINKGVDVTSFRITNSVRQEEFSYKAGYITFASSNCPEYTGNVLYVWGCDRSSDNEVIEIPTSFLSKLELSIEEYNTYEIDKTLSTIPLNAVKCCNHFFYDEGDCPCQMQVCKVCGNTHNKKEMRLVSHNNVDYYICKSHKKTVLCDNCETKSYFLVNHPNYDSIKVCISCCDIGELPYGEQLNYSHKPSPIFFDVKHKTVVTYNAIEYTAKKNVKTKFFFGHEVEQQIPDISNLNLLIGKMTDKQKDLIYCKSDSSIGYGTECVTHPFSWDFYKQHNWDGILNSAIVDWRKSQNKVGHHVHINLNSFSRLHLYRWLKFHHTHLKWVEFISQRELVSYCVPTGGSLTKALNKGRGGDKYEFINITANTAEWRAFASPITIEEFKKNCEYIYASYCWTKDNSKELTALALEDYISKHSKQYPNLLDFIESNKDNTTRHTHNREQDYRAFNTIEQRRQQRQSVRQYTSNPEPVDITHICARCCAIQEDTIRFSVLDVEAARMILVCDNCYNASFECEDCGVDFIGEPNYNDTYDCLCPDCV